MNFLDVKQIIFGWRLKVTLVSDFLDVQQFLLKNTWRKVLFHKASNIFTL
jgi:hypothetical protein